MAGHSGDSGLRWSWLAGLAIIALTCGAFAGGDGETDAVTAENLLLVANGNFEGSVELAKYYAARRGVPAANLLVLDAPVTQQVDFNDFYSRVRDPVRAWMRENGGKIRCIVTFHGVPLNIWEPLPAKTKRTLDEVQRKLRDLDAGRIKDDTADGSAKAALRTLTAKLKREIDAVRLTAAAVDSELALLDREHELFKSVDSPFVQEEGWPEGCYWVARLDATDAEDVRAMIDGALEAEAEGLGGTAYFDTRGLTKDDDYTRTDEAVERAARLMRGKGFATFVDNSEELFAPGACPDAAVYWGWYSLAKYVDSFEFVPGAVAVHIASGECANLRSGAYWCRNLIANGAAVTMGPVNEPYVQAFPPADDFLQMLFDGKSVGEAYYETLPQLSWRMVLLGDPLYRPFAAAGGEPGAGGSG